MAAKTSPKSKPARKATKKQPPAKKARVDPDAESATSDDDAGSPGYETAGDGSDDEDDDVEAEEPDSEELDGSDDEVDVSEIKKKRKAPAKSAAQPKGKKDGKNTREVQTGVKTAAPKEKATTSLILPSTMEFLDQLRNHNDRDWLAVNDAPYRHALLNWNTFINALVPIASEADWTLPQLPSKDLVHRIYRDVRFSNDKTPYKTNFAVSLSRTGRKSEKFCLYYLQIKPGNRSILAAGKWQPGGDVLKIIRAAILSDPQPLREVIAEPKFVKLFGEPTPGSRTNVYGQEDELKNCPKIAGVTKEHPDIDLLKLRSIAVSMTISDADVLSDTFLQTLRGYIEVLAPFVQLINEMVEPTPDDDDDE